MNVVVFDTETAGCKTQTLLNVGYKVCDLNPITAEAKTLVQRDYIVREILQNELFMLNDMFVGEDKWNQLRANVEHGGAILRTIGQIFAQMRADILRFKCIAGYAYNCAFDTDKFERTAIQYGMENPLDGLPVFDLWGMAFKYICETPEYIAFCKENQLLTESKRFWKTSVEGVTAFLTGNPEFTEEHTALSDVGWELKILQECIKRGANPFGSYEHGFIPSGYVFKKTIVKPDGEQVEIEYTRTARKWDAEGTTEFIR